MSSYTDSQRAYPNRSPRHQPSTPTTFDEMGIQPMSDAQEAALSRKPSLARCLTRRMIDGDRQKANKAKAKETRPSSPMPPQPFSTGHSTPGSDPLLSQNSKSGPRSRAEIIADKTIQRHNRKGKFYCRHAWESGCRCENRARKEGDMCFKCNDGACAFWHP
ncbi:uncharacterized protein J7T54_005960 [Emericellopsis cladophorae]|uniref:Uncharacterized protein n=1 Tax=Emericellopsis cladophorae TaxID=2686198 RepID=A0A9P9Y8X2_9HYPO|nr:uncharacterized protein J7T54_005960 [Emericellopsis cladophorae]KAI6785626.1 hypothetical protein J7T54_005960 [Emericellopsis cladophorae]